MKYCTVSHINVQVLSLKTLKIDLKARYLWKIITMIAGDFNILCSKINSLCLFKEEVDKFTISFVHCKNIFITGYKIICLLTVILTSLLEQTFLDLKICIFLLTCHIFPTWRKLNSNESGFLLSVSNMVWISQAT